MRQYFAISLVLFNVAWFAGCESNESTSPSAAAPRTDAANLAALYVEDLQGNQIPVLSGAPSRAAVFFFVRTECPISNRYVPEIQRLFEKFNHQGFRFLLVYPVAGESAATIENHLNEYRLPIAAVRDPSHALAQRCGATATPQVAVFLPDGKTLAYCGRIDDRYVDFGVSRVAPTTHDLEDALEAVLAGQSPDVTTTPVVGCPIGKPL